MEKAVANRGKIQDYALYLSSVFDHVVLSWATGVGKSLAAIRIIKEYIEKNPDNYKVWYIVVAESQHIDNWMKEFRKHGMEKLIDLGYVHIFCYASLKKYEYNEANLVLDEAHSITKERLKYLMTIKADKIVSLSATIPADKMILLRVLRGNLREYKITTDQAIKAGILPEPTIIKVPVKMSESDAQLYNKITAQIEKSEVDSRIMQLSLNVDPGKVLMRHRKIRLDATLMQLRMKRKKIVCESKTGAGADIAEMLDNDRRRYICFTGSIEQCEQIGGVWAIHSGLTEKETEARIKCFQEGVTNSIFTNRMLRQGTNLNNIEAGIVVQLDATELPFIQMMGRVFRSSKPLLFVLVCEGTVDDKWWEWCTENIDSKYITTFDEYKKRQEDSES